MYVILSKKTPTKILKTVYASHDIDGDVSSVFHQNKGVVVKATRRENTGNTWTVGDETEDRDIKTEKVLQNI